MKEFIKNLDLTDYRKASWLLKKNKDLQNFCQEYLNKYPSLEKLFNVLHFIQNNEYLPICKHCGNPINYTWYLWHKNEYCSIKCSKEGKSNLIALHNKYEKAVNLFKNYVEPLFTSNEYKGRQYIYKWKCKHCGEIFEANLIKTTKFLTYLTGDIKLKRCPRCPNCYKKYQNYSKNESNLLNFCKQYFNNIETHKRDLIPPYEIDIYIPDIKLAIEFNGVHWHSINNKETGYHLNKTKMCNKLGVRLIHIWEDEWLNNSTKICEKLKLIFTNNEVFTENKLILDQCWYNNLNLSNYILIETKSPEIITRLNKPCENCGYLIYEKRS